MKKEDKLCGRCGRKHPWGIVGRKDGVPLYNWLSTTTCLGFREFDGDNLPEVKGLPLDIDQRDLWAMTGDLNAQATMATRLVVRRLKSLGRGKSGYEKISIQWPEFIGFVISQITDMRGALVRD